MLYKQFQDFEHLVFENDYGVRVMIFFTKNFKCCFSRWRKESYSEIPWKNQKFMGYEIQMKHFKYAERNCMSSNRITVFTQFFNPKTKIRKLKILF